MSKLITRELDLGRVLQKSTTIRSTKLEKPTLRISTSCGCTAAKARDGQLIVTYTAPDYPRYKIVLDEMQMPIEKKVTILYQDDTKEIITLKAIVIP